MLALFGQQRESHELLQELRSALSHTNKVPTPHSRVVDDLIERRRLIYTPNKTEIDEEWSVYLPPPPAIADPVADLLHVFEPVHAVLPLLDYGWTLLVQGQLGEATYCLEKVVDLANQTAQPSIASTAYHQLAVTSRILGDLEQSQALNEQSMAINRATPGVPAELASMWPRIASAFLSLEAGRIDEAERRLRRVLDFLEDRNSFRAYRNSANIGLGLVHLRRGESELARALLETALVDLSNLYPYTHVRALLGMAEIATQSGTKEAAVNYLRRALHFAGRRSLIEEYLAALRTIARLHIADVPWERLRASFLAYTESIGLKPAGEQLVQLT
jgi:ATP/maltotriose-dependent transcriptional regulator MalT